MRSALKGLVAALVIAACTTSSVRAETVLITGSNRGIGLAFAVAYAQKGWTVIATARNPEASGELKTLAAKHKTVALERLDVTDAASIAALAAKYKGKPVDLLLNNAGIGDFEAGATLGHFDAKLFDRVMNTNVLGPLLVSQAFLVNVAASGQKKIVAITSPTAALGRPVPRQVRRAHTYYYSTSKTALNMAMKTLAAEVRERGVIVGIVHPGGVDTDMLRAAYGGKSPASARTPDQAVAGMVRVIDGLTLDNSDQVMGYDGKPFPW
jgi:NAD(P)-dependent dehydrogenase (short-subunit alcohol dehydrogenase family)